MNDVAPGSINRLRWWMTFCLGALCGLVVAFVVWAKWTRPNVPQITREKFHAARQRWRERGPENYDLQVKLSGRQAATFALRVRGGRVESATRNGQPLADRRTLDTWSVPGMFDTIGVDLEHQDRIAAGTALPQAPRLLLQGEFDATYGFPRQYLRTERDGAKTVAAWDVVEFRVK